MILILGPAQVTQAHLVAWLPRFHPHPRYLAVLPLYWEIAPRYGVRPEVAALQAGKETGWGHYGGVVAPEFHNWCGLKTTRGGSNTDPNAHARFPDDRTGVLAHIQHLARYAGASQVAPGDPLVDPRWEKVTVTIAHVEDLGGHWAPSPTYGREIARFVARLITFASGITLEDFMPERAQMLAHLERRYPLRIRESLIPAGNPNRPGTPAIPEGRRWITVHETGNTKPGANAEMHRRFTHDGGGDAGVSFTWVVDDTEAIRLVPRNEKTWQASDGADGVGNSSESIEACVNSDGDWSRTRENLARLICRILVEDPARAPERIAQHHKWARDRKHCPAKLRANHGAGWAWLLGRVRAILQDIGYFGDPYAHLPAIEDPWRATNPYGKHFWIPTPFAEEIKRHDWMLTGYCIAGAFMEKQPDGQELLVQYFERARLELQRDGRTVTRGLVGRELLEVRRS